MDLTAKLLVLCCQFGVHWSLENPATSYLWDMPPVRFLAARDGVGRFNLDMCRFQSKHKKPTALLSDCDLSALALSCDRDARPHVHEPLVGMVMSKGKKIFKTKLAQVYPTLLCQAWAKVIASLQADPLAATFQMAVPAHERKRPLGQPLPWVVHKQRATAEKARDAGYQLKRSALPPILPVEMEPGQAVQQALQVPILSLWIQRLIPIFKRLWRSSCISLTNCLVIGKVLYSFGLLGLSVFCRSRIWSSVLSRIPTCGRYCAGCPMTNLLSLARSRMSPCGESCSLPVAVLTAHWWTR